jgi:hypothetical protein
MIGITRYHGLLVKTKTPSKAGKYANSTNPRGHHTPPGREKSFGLFSNLI